MTKCRVGCQIWVVLMADERGDELANDRNSYNRMYMKKRKCTDIDDPWFTSRSKVTDLSKMS